MVKRYATDPKYETKLKEKEKYTYISMHTKIDSLQQQMINYATSAIDYENNKISIKFSGLLTTLLAVLFIGLKPTNHIDWSGGGY